MLKKVTLGYTIAFFVIFLWYVLTLLFGGTNQAIFLSEFPKIFVINNITGFITMVICSIKLQKNDPGYVIRVVPFWIIVGTLASIFANFDALNINGFSTHGTILETTAGGIAGFISSSYLYVLPLSLLSLLNPNNKLCKILKIIGYLAVFATFVSNIWVMIKSEMIDIIPNVYNTMEAFSTLDNTLTIADMVLYVSLVIEISVVCFGFLLNYSLEADTIQSENLEYDDLIKQAEYVANEKQKMLRGEVAPQMQQIDRSVSEQTGYMNINNQLGVNSNVGKVDKAATSMMRQDAIDRNIISVGPVVNASVAPKPEPVQQQVQQVAQQPAPQPQPLDQPVAQQPMTQQAPVQQPVQVQQVPVQQPVQVQTPQVVTTPVQNTAPVTQVQAPVVNEQPVQQNNQ